MPRSSAFFEATFGPVRWVALTLVGCMWLNLNTGFWNINWPSSFGELQLVVRACLPYAVLPVALLGLFQRGRVGGPMHAGPSNWLMIYGLVAALGTVLSYSPGASQYWSVTFIAAILASWTYTQEPAAWLGGRQIVALSWVVALVGAAVLVSLVPETALRTPGGGSRMAADLEELSRSSGVARWAAVPGLVCLSRCVQGRGSVGRLLYFGVACFCLFVVYRMQSRGAMFGVLGAAVFLIVASRPARRLLIPVAGYGLLAAGMYGAMGGFEDSAIEYVRRGQTDEQLASMTGRVDIYARAAEEVATSPLIGRGQWADRLSPTIESHSHNSFVQALLNAGVVGFLPYVWSWIAGWRLWLFLWKRRQRLEEVDRGLVLECGLVMSFFALRAIPETTSASFSVDLMVIVACYGYLESLVVALSSGRSNATMGPRWSLVE